MLAFQADTSFIINKPLTIVTAATIRSSVAGSPMKKIPAAKAPTAPMPVQMVYAVPSGKFFIENESSAKLAMTVMNVITVGTNRVNPSDCFIENAHTTSNRPATIKLTQAMSHSQITGKQIVRARENQRTNLIKKTPASTGVKTG